MDQKESGPAKAPEPDQERSGRFRQTFASLKERNFRIYASGQLVSLIGTWMQITALPWLVYSITKSASALGMVSFAGSLPLLLLTYFGGTLADKFDRKKVLITMQSLAMIQAVLLFAVAFYGLTNIYLLVALALFSGCITALDLPSRQAFVADLVGKENLTNAISLNSAIWNSSRMIGPALAGLIIGLFGEAICFGINAFSFLASLGTLMALKVVPKKADENEPCGEADNPCKENESVFRVMLTPALLSVLLLSMITSTFGFTHGILMPVIVDEILKGTAETLGILSAAAGLGALMGSLTLAGTKNNQRMSSTIGLACLVLSLAIFTLGQSTSLTLSIAAIALAGAAVSMQLSGGMSIVQHTVSNSMRGRIMGVYSTCMIGFAPFAAMLAGTLGSSVGVTATLSLCAAVVAGSALLYLLYLFYVRLTRPGKVRNDRS